MLKKILFAGIGLLLFWQAAIFIVEKLDGVTTQSTLLLAFIGWTINMFVTGAFAIPGFVLPTQRLLPAGYYRIDHPERTKRYYHRLGGELFRRFLLLTFWRNPEQRERYFNGRADGLDHLHEQSTKAEFGHLMPFLLLGATAVYVGGRHGKWQLAAWIMCFNILGNFYPVLLQRYHRARLQRMEALRLRRKS